MMETEQEALAATVDTLNSWARELGGSEAHNLREAAALADRLWAQCSRRIHNAETKAEAERTARQKAEAERDAALALVGRTREALAYALDQFHYDLPHSAGAISKGRKVLAEPVPSAEVVAAAMRDKERLDWLDEQGDINVLQIDPDLVGSPVIAWGPYTESARKVREAIDAAIERAKGGANGS